MWEFTWIIAYGRKSLRTKIAGCQWWVQERAVSRRIEEVLVKAEVDLMRVPALLQRAVSGTPTKI